MPEVRNNPQFSGIQQGPTASPGAGMALGRALSGLGATAGQAADTIDRRLFEAAELETRAKLLEDEGEIAEASQKFWEWTLTNQDTSDWDRELNERWEILGEELSEKGGSPDYARRRSMLLKGKRSAVFEKMRSQGAMLRTQQAKTTFVRATDRALENADYDRYEYLLREGHRAGIIDDNDLQYGMEKGDRRQQISEYDPGNLSTPELPKKIEELEAKGDSGYKNARSLDESDRKKLLSVLERERLSRQNDAIERINAQVGGRIKTVQEYRRALENSGTFGGPGGTVQMERVVRAYKRSLGPTNQQRAILEDRIDNLHDLYQSMPRDEYEEKRLQIQNELNLMGEHPEVKRLRGLAAELRPEEKDKEMGKFVEWSVETKMKTVRDKFRALTDHLMEAMKPQEKAAFYDKRDFVLREMRKYLLGNPEAREVNINEELMKILAEDDAGDIIFPHPLLPEKPQQKRGRR